MSNFDLKPVAASPNSNDALSAVVLELLQATEQLVGIFDEHDILRFANPAFVQLFHLHPDGNGTWMDLLRNNYQHRHGCLINTQDFEAWLASARSRRGKEPFRAFKFDTHGDRWFWMTETTLANGWMLCVASEITSLHQDRRSLRQTRDLALRTAQTDPLTGISNRAHAKQLTDELIAQGQSFMALHH